MTVEYRSALGAQIHAYLRIRLNLKPPFAEMALASERVDGRAVVGSDLLLLSVVTHAHANVVVACSATANCQRGRWDIDESCMLTTRC